MSSTDEKRRKFDYRSSFFHNDPGLMGVFYQCAQCGRILTKRNTQVDHIIPLKSHLGINAQFNLGPICGKCNKSKGAKKDIRLFQGYLIKFTMTPLRLLNRMSVKCFSNKSFLGSLLNVVIRALAGVVGFLYMFVFYFILTIISVLQTFIRTFSHSRRHNGNILSSIKDSSFQSIKVILFKPLFWISCCLVTFYFIKY